MADHQWQRDVILGEGIVMTCVDCPAVWRPHQFRPKSSCPVGEAREAAQQALQRAVEAALSRTPDRQDEGN